MNAVADLAPTVGIVAACDFLSASRASFYRQRPILGPPLAPPRLPESGPGTALDGGPAIPPRARPH